MDEKKENPNAPITTIKEYKDASKTFLVESLIFCMTLSVLSHRFLIGKIPDEEQIEIAMRISSAFFGEMVIFLWMARTCYLVYTRMEKDGFARANLFYLVFSIIGLVGITIGWFMIFNH